MHVTEFIDEGDFKLRIKSVLAPYKYVFKFQNGGNGLEMFFRDWHLLRTFVAEVNAAYKAVTKERDPIEQR